MNDRAVYLELAKHATLPRSRRIYLANYNRVLQQQWKKAAVRTAAQ